MAIFLFLHTASECRGILFETFIDWDLLLKHYILFSLMYRGKKGEEPGKYQLQFVKLGQNRLQINKN